MAPEKAEPDKRLFGRWKSPDPKEKGEPVTVALAAKKLKNAPAGLIEFQEKPGKIGKPKSIYALSTQVGKDYYLQFVKPKKNAPDPLQEWNKADVEGYMIFKYAIDGDRWAMWLMDPDVTAKLVETGKLKGTVKKGGFVGLEVKLKESTENLRRFLEGAEGPTLFPDKGKAVLERAKS